jgi:hypothetical protein
VRLFGRIGSPVIALLLAGSIVSSALAASVHFKPPHSEPTFTDGGLFLSATGELAGLGNEDIVVTLSAQGNVDAVCINPGNGDHRPPGQNPAAVTLTGTEVIPASEIKNGTVEFSVQTASAPSQIEGAPGCPNPSWTELVTDVAFTSATLTVEQPAGTVVLTAVCTFSPPTSDGLVPDANVSCTVS